MDNAEALNKAVDNITVGVEKLAAVIEKIAPDAWDIIVRQQVIDGWIYVAIGMIFNIIFIVGCIKLYLAAAAEDRKPPSKYDDPPPVRVVLLVITCALMTLSTWGCTSGITRIINPEYFAAQEVTKMIK